MEEYLTYITNIVDDADANPDQKDMPPLFSITRSTDLEEREATALAGYRGMGPVRVGNAAYTQIQNDAYGSIVLASTHAFFDRAPDPRRRTGPCSSHLERLGRRAIEVFDQPDAGPWELRTKAAVHTFPSVMCWAACDRLGKIAGPIGRPDRAEYWRSEADRMHAVINEKAFNQETRDLRLVASAASTRRERCCSCRARFRQGRRSPLHRHGRGGRAEAAPWRSSSCATTWRTISAACIRPS